MDYYKYAQSIVRKIIKKQYLGIIQRDMIIIVLAGLLAILNILLFSEDPLTILAFICFLMILVIHLKKIFEV